MKRDKTDGLISLVHIVKTIFFVDNIIFEYVVIARVIACIIKWHPFHFIIWIKQLTAGVTQLE
jgi:hypothetical protein